MPCSCQCVKSPTRVTLIAVGALNLKVCFLPLSMVLAILNNPFHGSAYFGRRNLKKTPHWLRAPEPIIAKPFPILSPSLFYTQCQTRQWESESGLRNCHAEFIATKT